MKRTLITLLAFLISACDDSDSRCHRIFFSPKQLILEVGNERTEKMEKYQCGNCYVGRDEDGEVGTCR